MKKIYDLIFKETNLVAIFLWSLAILCISFVLYKVIQARSVLVYGMLLTSINVLRKYNKNLNEQYIIVLFTSIATEFTVYLLYKYMANAKILLYLGLIIILINTALVILNKNGYILDIVIKFRYLIGLIVFIICLIFQVHGSSINFYNNIFTDLPVDNNVIFGSANWLRSDEYNVQTPYYFSQYFNDYQEKSNQMSIGGQDMIIGYNAPVNNVTAIGKPFTWGYLLFGNSYGLSWYWCSKTILCVLVMLELCLIITKGSKGISIIGSLLIVFSPAMQWWFSPHMYDVFFWGASLGVVGYHFFVSDELWKKIVTTILSSCVIIGFVLALFPSLQVAVGLAMFVILVACLLRDKDEIKFTKFDILRIIIVVICVSGVLGSFLLNAKDELIKLSSTVYPGARISVGGDRSLSDLFSNIMCIITPYKNSNILNNCEIATFNHVGLLSIMLYIYYFIKRKKDNKELIVGGAFFLIMFVQILFMIIGMPEWMAKLTLFSYINRMTIAYGFIATLFTIWTIYYYIKHRKELNNYIVVTLLFVFCVLNYMSLEKSYFEFMSVWYYIGVLFFVSIIIISILLNKNHIANVMLIVIIFISSCTINPICRGTTAIDGHSLSTAIANIVNKDEGNWIATESLFAQNFLLANGAKALNSINFYPDYGKWNIIDIGNKYDDVYNRYANIRVSVGEETEFAVINPDLIRVTLTASDIKKMNIKYVLSFVDYKDYFEINNIDFKVNYKDNTGYMIYTLNY